MVNECLANDALYMEWTCLDWNTNAIEFYARHNAYPVNDLHLVRLDRSRILLD
jgi:hypothetical protein